MIKILHLLWAIPAILVIKYSIITYKLLTYLRGYNDSDKT